MRTLKKEESDFLFLFFIMCFHVLKCQVSYQILISFNLQTSINIFFFILLYLMSFSDCLQFPCKVHCPHLIHLVLKYVAIIWKYLNKNISPFEDCAFIESFGILQIVLTFFPKSNLHRWLSQLGSWPLIWPNCNSPIGLATFNIFF